MEIVAPSTDASMRGEEANFTGEVWIDRLGVGAGKSTLRVDNVTFMPGARTRWHSHPVGQILYVISGVGHIALAGQEVCRLTAGDRVRVDAGERHWHGAAADRVFVHIAIQETDDAGKEADWFEPVSDDNYAAAGSSR